MKKQILFSIVSLLLVSAVLFSLVPPAHASAGPGIEINVNPVDFWDWLVGLANGIDNEFLFVFDHSVCPKDTQHVPGRHNFIEQRTNVGGKVGLYYICEYCGKSAGEVAPDAYNSYVNDVQGQLGTATVGNNGFRLPIYVDNNCDVISLPGYTSSASWNTGVDVDFYFGHSDKAPVDGTYVLHYSVSNSNCSIKLSAKDGKSVVLSKGSVLEESFGVYSRIYVLFRFGGQYQSPSSAVVSAWLDVTPFEYSVNDFTTNIGGIDSRAGSLHGDYGIIGDGGTINHVENDYIFDETTNTYYNPTTNTSTTVTDWTYDYSTRSYTLTLDTGDTVTVTYGDENITVNQGGDTYNVYYIIDGTGGGEDPSPNPSPSTHRHNYSSEVTAEPSCTLTGTRTYTCEECGHTYTETIPANGHKWEVKTTVQTEYDDDGNLIVEGYTIYKCSVCGEEYKDSDGNGPPGGGGSGSSGESKGVFKGIFGLFWDFCSFMLDLFNDFIVDGIKGFLDMIMDGASGFFDILNPVGWFT